MNKSALTILTIAILIACAISYSEAGFFEPSSDIVLLNEKVNEIIDNLKNLQRKVSENENTVNKMWSELNELTIEVNILREKHGMTQVLSSWDYLLKPAQRTKQTL